MYFTNRFGCGGSILALIAFGVALVLGYNFSIAFGIGCIVLGVCTGIGYFLDVFEY